MFGERNQESVKKVGNYAQKKTKRYHEQDPGKVKEFKEKIATVPPDRIAYVDESGIDNYLYREYGWSQRGEKIYARISGKKYRRTGIVAAKMGKEIIEPLQYGGTMDSLLFEAWFELRLLPALPLNTTIVMDNASFHRKSRLIAIAEKHGHTILFLPPYSPELNPIENFWSWLKARLRNILHRFDSFDDALSDCFQVR